MKKLQLLIMAMLLGIVSLNAQNRDLSTLLAQLQTLSNTPLSIDDVIKQNFNVTEQAILLNHLESLTGSSSTNSNSFLAHTYHVLNLRGGAQDFGTMASDPPFVLNTIVAPLGISCFADDFDENGILYGLAYDSVSTSTNFVTVDTSDGTVVVLGDITAAIGAVVPTGLAFDFTTLTMYATAANNLYTVDLSDGTPTLVGAMGTTTSIWLVIDNDGLAYAADISDDNFYSVDLTTGGATLIGPLGVDLGFAQEATVNPETNEIFMAAYTGGGTGGVYSIDPVTGMGTLIGDTGPLDAEFGMFSVSGTPPIVGIGENISSQMSIYPNPATKGVVTIETSVQGEKQVTIFDVLGKKVIDTVISDTELNVSSLKGGVYIVQVIQNNATATRKLIIK